MIPFAVQSAGTVLLGLCAGGLFSLWQTGGSIPSDDAMWVTDPHIGSYEAGLVTRARTARRGLFALRRSEAVYFTRARDDAGRALDASCSYVLAGSGLPAAWWSITVYDADDFLVRNGDDAASVNADTPGIAPDGWSVQVGPSRPGSGPWLSTARAGAFDLTLRLYEPDAELSGEAALPSLRRLSCLGDRP